MSELYRDKFIECDKCDHNKPTHGKGEDDCDGDCPVIGSEPNFEVVQDGEKQVIKIIPRGEELTLTLTDIIELATKFGYGLKKMVLQD